MKWKHGGLCWLSTCIQSLISYIYQTKFAVITNLYLLLSVYSATDINFTLAFVMFGFIQQISFTSVFLVSDEVFHY